MKIEILYFDGCPSYRTTGETLRQVLAEEGLEADIELVAVNSDEEAQGLRFPGSPTISRRRSRPFSHARARGLAIGLPGLCYP